MYGSDIAVCESNCYIYIYTKLKELESPRNKHKEHHEGEQDPQNAKKPRHAMRLLPRDLNVHAPERRDQMHGDENGRQHGNLTDNLVDIQTHPQIGGAQMRQAVRLRAADDLVEVRQVRHGGDQMVLHVTEVHEEVAVGEDRVLVFCLAALHEAVQDVALAVEAVHEVGDFLAEVIDARDEDFGVVDAGDEDLVLDRFGFEGGGAHEGFEAVDDVVAGCC